MENMNQSKLSKFSFYSLKRFLRAGSFALLAATLVACGSGGEDGKGHPGHILSVDVKYSGVAEQAIVLQNNGADDLTVERTGPAKFHTPIPNGGSYLVTVKSAPEGYLCQLGANNRGSNITRVPPAVGVVCADQSNTFPVGGTVSGLVDGTQVVLQNNGGDTVAVLSNGTYEFPTQLVNGAAYSVAILENPDKLLCTVSNPAGIIENAAVTNVDISCVPSTYTLGGTVTDLAPGQKFTIENNGVSLTITENGTYQPYPFSTPFSSSVAYDVIVTGQPDNQTCVVSNAKPETNPPIKANVTNVDIKCNDNGTPQWKVGGNVGGLVGSNTITLVNTLNNSDTLNNVKNGDFKFDQSVFQGSDYNVDVLNVPHDQTCGVTNGSGTVGAGDVSNVSVTCGVKPQWQVKAEVTGLKSGESVVLGLNSNGNSDPKTIEGNGNDISVPFDQAVYDGDDYNVAVVTNPNSQKCTVGANGNGKASGDVVVGVTCADVVYKLSVTVTGLYPGNKVMAYDEVPGYGVTVTENNQTTFIREVAQGSYYKVVIPNSPALGNGYPTLQDCTITNSEGFAYADANVQVTCGSAAPTVLTSFPNEPGFYSMYPVALMHGNDGNFYGLVARPALMNLFENTNTAYVYKMTPSGVMTKLHTFVGVNNAHIKEPALPTGIVQINNDNFYVSTFLGSASTSTSAVYKLTASTRTVEEIFSLNNSRLGPASGLIKDAGGNFYGVTYGNVLYDAKRYGGAVIKISASGAIETLHDFGQFVDAPNTNGLLPSGKLLLAKDGFLYGTTEKGGQHNTGAIFRINPNKALGSNFEVLASFDVADAYTRPRLPPIDDGNNNPVENRYLDPYSAAYSGLIQANDGSLYGVAKGGSGRIFKFDLSTKRLSSFYTFTPGNAAPVASLIQLGTGNNFYGVTTGGGANGLGTIYMITPAQVLTTLYSFEGNASRIDGAKPNIGLVADGNGNLYGATSGGGTNNQGVFYKFFGSN